MQFPAEILDGNRRLCATAVQTCADKSSVPENHGLLCKQHNKIN